MKKRTEWEKKKYSYINSKQNKLNNKLSPSLQDKNAFLVNQSVKKLFEPIMNSIHLQSLTIKNKNKQITQNLKDISKIQTQIQNIQNRQLHKKEELMILQEKIKQKRKRKNEVINLYGPYYNILEDNNILLNQQIEELFKKEINILLQEKALQQLRNINSNHNSIEHNLTETNTKEENDNLLESNIPICINSSNRYKDFIDNINNNPQINKRNHMNSTLIHTFQSSQISSITKHNNSMYANKSNNNKNKIFISTTSSFENDKYNKDSNKIKKTSSLPFINLNKEQIDIMNKTYLNEDDFSKILSDYKSKNCTSSQNCKTPSQRQSITKAKTFGKENQINDSSFNNSVHTGHNSKESGGFIGNLGSSFYSQIRVQTPFKSNYLKQKSKGINSSKEKLKEFLINENKANFSMCTDDKFIKEGINSSPGNHINKSKSSAIIKEKNNNDINSINRIYRHAKSLQKNSIEIKMLNMFNNKTFVSQIKEIIRKNIIKKVVPLILLYVVNKKEFVLKIISDNLIKKYYIQKLIEILKECINCYNNRIQMKEEANVDDFFNDENEDDISSSSENIKFDNYMDKLNKFKQLTYEMKEMESNMKEFIEQVYDDE